MLPKKIFLKDIIIIKLIMVSFFLLIKTSHSIEQYTAHGGPVKGLAVSASNNLMASASFDYSVVIWDLNPIKEKLTLIGHDAAVNTVKFSPNNDFLASGGDDNNILLWALKDINNLNEESQKIRFSLSNAFQIKTKKMKKTSITIIIFLFMSTSTFAQNQANYTLSLGFSPFGGSLNILITNLKKLLLM